MLKDNLTKDYLPGYPNIILYQHTKMFRVNTDTSLLGHYIDIPMNARVLDVGTNNGALLLYASMLNYKSLVGIDINSEALEIAKLNLEINNVKNYYLINENIKNFYDKELFDVIISNPPYFNTQNENLKNQNIYLKMARHEEYLMLEDLIKSISLNLKKEGTFFLVHIASRFNEINQVLNRYNLFINEFVRVRDERKVNDHVILMKITKNKKEIVEKENIIIKR